MINCEAYTVKYVKEQKAKTRLKRDNIYFVIFKTDGSISYALELSPVRENGNLYIPKSLRINDENIKYYAEIELQFIKRKRIKSPKIKNKVKWVNEKESDI